SRWVRSWRITANTARRPTMSRHSRNAYPAASDAPGSGGVMPPPPFPAAGPVSRAGRQDAAPLRPDARVELLRRPGHDGEGVAPGERLARVDDDAGIAAILLGIAHRVQMGRPAAAQDVHPFARIAAGAHGPDHGVHVR